MAVEAMFAIFSTLQLGKPQVTDYIVCLIKSQRILPSQTTSPISTVLDDLWIILGWMWCSKESSNLCLVCLEPTFMPFRPIECRPCSSPRWRSGPPRQMKLSCVSDRTCYLQNEFFQFNSQKGLQSTRYTPHKTSSSSWVRISPRCVSPAIMRTRHSI